MSSQAYMKASECTTGTTQGNYIPLFENNANYQMFLRSYTRLWQILYYAGCSRKHACFCTDLGLERLHRCGLITEVGDTLCLFSVADEVCWPSLQEANLFENSNCSISTRFGGYVCINASKTLLSSRTPLLGQTRWYVCPQFVFLT